MILYIIITLLLSVGLGIGIGLVINRFIVPMINPYVQYERAVDGARSATDHAARAVASMLFARRPELRAREPEILAAIRTLIREKRMPEDPRVFAIRPEWYLPTELLSSPSEEGD